MHWRACSEGSSIRVRKRDCRVYYCLVFSKCSNSVYRIVRTDFAEAFWSFSSSVTRVASVCSAAVMYEAS